MRFVREASLRLPREVVFAVIPFRPESRESASWLASHGFDVMCHMPMQPLDRGREEDDSGVVRIGMDDATVARTVAADLEAVPHAVGVNNHEGSRATTDPGLMEAAMRVLRSRGLFFIDSRTGPRSVAEKTARKLGIPTAGRDVFLDDDPDPAAIESQWKSLLRLARANGRALAIGHARTSTLDTLESVLPLLEKENIRLVAIREYLGTAPVTAVR